MSTTVVCQLNMAILNALSRACYDIIQQTIDKFRETPGLNNVSEANVNFVAMLYEPASELLYAEEISSCRNSEGYIEGIIGTIYVFKRMSDAISIPDQFMEKITFVPDMDRVFEGRPKFSEIFSTSNSLIFYPEDLKALGIARIKKPVFH